MDAISGTRRAMKEMADGTIRVQVDVDPSCRADFLRLFPNIDMPVALAPLLANFEQTPAVTKPKGGDLARLAGQLCQQIDFHLFVSEQTTGGYGPVDKETAADWVREYCGIESRAELDSNPQAAARFHEGIRKPFLKWKDEAAR